MTKITTVDLYGDGLAEWDSTCMDRTDSAGAAQESNAAAIDPEVGTTWGRNQVNKSVTNVNDAFMRFGRRGGNNAQGIGIPARATIVSATLHGRSSSQSIGPFTGEYYFLVRDGKWDLYHATGWAVMGNQGPQNLFTNRDLMVTISGSDESVELHNVSFSSAFDRFYLSQYHYSPVSCGHSFEIGTGVAPSVVSSVRTIARRNGAIGTPDYDTWAELYSIPDGEDSPNSSNSILLGISDIVTFSGMVNSNNTWQTYNFSEVVTLSGNAGSSNNYFWAVHSDKNNHPDVQPDDISSILITHRGSSGFSGFPTLSGNHQNAFSEDLYGFRGLLPAEDFQTPFGSKLSIATPTWSSEEVITISGMGLLMQEWIDDEGYDPNVPVALGLSRGNSTDQQKTLYATSASGHPNDPFLRVEYTTRRVTVV